MNPPTAQNAYRLPYSTFNVLTSKTGKLEEQTLTDAHHEVVNPPTAQNSYRLPYITFNVFTSKTGKLEEQTLTDVYHEAVAPPTPINAYRLLYRNFNVLTSKTGKPTHTKRLPTLSMRQWPHPLPKTITAYHIAFSMYLSVK